MRKISASAENAIAGAIKMVLDAGGDAVTVDALIDQMECSLNEAGFELRGGFDVIARGYIKLSKSGAGMRALRERRGQPVQLCAGSKEA